MPTETVHIPPDLLEALDSLAARRGESRSRVVVEACRRLVEEDLGAWPEGFFELSHLTPRERQELGAAGREMEEAIYSARRNRRRPPS